MKKKVLLAIADGVGDRPCEELGWKTPLQYADTGCLDELAKGGACGIMDLYHAGIPVGTDLWTFDFIWLWNQRLSRTGSDRSIWRRRRTHRRRCGISVQLCYSR